mmetsp:Transcript_62145/g.128900  ORF Transcript_62145/g.128900 Transcript_62145/m.128900 type:complete len:1024 (+) Transcript_62145:190-3261(+)
MDSEIERKLAHVIAKEDEVCAVLEVSKDDTGHARTIAIVCAKRSSSQPEYALFVCKKKRLRAKLMIRHIVPILADFSVTKVSPEVVELKYRKYADKTKTKIYRAVNADALRQWTLAASNAVVVACHQNYNLNSFCSRRSHSWLLERYADDVPGLKQMVVGLNGQVAVNSDSDSNDDNQVTDHPVALTMMTSSAREDWIQKKCLQRADEFVNRRALSVRVCSWNVGAQLRPEEGKIPSWSSEQIHQWLIPDPANPTDIISVGLQEIVTLQANSLANHDSSTEKNAWEDVLCTALQMGGDKYTMLVSRQYVGIYHFLAVRTELWDQSIVREPQCKAVGCGIMGFGGNKGAVSVRLLVYDSSICFVCSHLAAHQTQVDRRNRDHSVILRSTLFDGTNRHGVVVSGDMDKSTEKVSPSPFPGLRPVSSGAGGYVSSESSITNRWSSFEVVGDDDAQDAAGGSVAKDGRLVKGIEEHDVVVWFGDLNYRIDMEREEVLQEIAHGRLETLWERDQLKRQREEGHAFRSYCEGRPLFRPTYKLEPSTGMYSSDKDKLRTPAWCDRVLWKCSRGSCEQKSFTAEEKLLGSDHRAIGTTLQLTVEEIAADRRAKVRDSIEAELDAATTACLPAAEFDMSEVVLEAVRYRLRQRREVRLRNTGQVAVHFTLASVMLGAGDTDAPTWMMATPPRGVLMPGESIKIVIAVHVGDRVAASLLGDDVVTLEALVVVKIDGCPEDSRPIIAVRAKCLPSCFGRSLANLARRRHAVRAPPPVATAHGPVKKQTKLPNEIWRLVGALYQRGMQCHRLFLDYGAGEEAAEVRECLDTGRPFPATLSPLALGEVLLQLLRSLPTPVVTAQVRDRCIACHASLEGVLSALEGLSTEHVTTLVYIVSFLKALLQMSSHNQLSADALALVFAGTLLSPDRLERNRPPPQVLKSLQKEQAVMMHLLAPGVGNSSSSKNSQKDNNKIAPAPAPAPPGRDSSNNALQPPSSQPVSSRRLTRSRTMESKSLQLPWSGGSGKDRASRAQS